MQNSKPVDYTFIEITGTDSDKFLLGQLTIATGNIASNKASLAAFCNPKGRVVSLFHIYKIEEGYRLFLPRTLVEYTLSHINKYAVFFKIEVAELLPKCIVYGFKYSSFNANEEIESDDRKSKLIQLTSSRLAFHCFESDDIYEQLNNSASIQPINGNYEWQSTLAEFGIPWLSDTSSSHFLPHSLNLPTLAAVDFTKGCFTGQEVIARMQYKGKLKQQLHILRCDKTLDLTPKDKLYQGGKAVAEVVCSVSTVGKPSYLLALVKDRANKTEFFQLNTENSPILELIEKIQGCYSF